MDVEAKPRATSQEIWDYLTSHSGRLEATLKQFQEEHPEWTYSLGEYRPSRLIVTFTSSAVDERSPNISALTPQKTRLIGAMLEAFIAGQNLLFVPSPVSGRHSIAFSIQLRNYEKFAREHGYYVSR